MAKARNTTNVRTRAIKAWLKANACEAHDTKLSVHKSRKNSTITVKDAMFGAYPITWSYKGGSLRKIDSLSRQRPV